MKKSMISILLLLLLLAVALPGALASETPSDEDPYVFQDPVIEAVVRSSIKNDPITYGDLKEMRYITITIQEETLSLNDLAYMSGLKDIYISPGDDVSPELDLSPIAGLEKLEKLRLNGCRDIHHLEVVAGLPKLKQLHLDGEWLTDEKASALHSLTQLDSLKMEKTAQTDLSWVADFHELTSLWIDCDGLTDLSWIVGLEKLEYVNIKGKNLSDGSPLALLPELRVILDTDFLAKNCDLTALFGNAFLKVRPGAGDLYFDSWYPEYCAEQGIKCREAGDEETANMWFDRGEKYGNASQLYSRGELFENSIVPRPEQALLWYTLAAHAGSEEAVKAVERAQRAADKLREEEEEKRRKDQELLAAVREWGKKAEADEAARLEAEAAAAAEAAWLEANGTPYTFKDPTVEHMVRLNLQKDEQAAVMVEELPKIVRLNLNIGSDGIVLEDLPSLPKLEVLNLKGEAEAGGSVDLAPLADCQGLMELSLSSVGEMENFEVITSLSQLKDLWIYNDFMTDEQAALIGGFAQLEALHLEGMPITDISWIKDCKALKEVVIAYTNVASADALGELSSLEFVAFEHNAGHPDLSFLLGRDIRSWSPFGEEISFDEWYAEYRYGYTEPTLQESEKVRQGPGQVHR